MSYRNYSTANGLIIDPNGNGDFTTIQAAINATSGQKTLFIHPATYSENITLRNGISLISMSPLVNDVIISGKVSFSAAGFALLSNIMLINSGDFSISCSGAGSQFLYLNNCSTFTVDFDSISQANSNPSSLITARSCNLNLGALNTAYFQNSGVAGSIYLDCFFANGFFSTKASLVSSGFVQINNATSTGCFSTSDTGYFIIQNSNIDCSVINTAALTHNGTGTASTIFNSSFAGGTSSALSVGVDATLEVYNSSVSSSDTNAITGAGTIKYSGITFSGTSKTINTTTQTDCGTLQGSKNTAPSAGFLGEQIISVIAPGSPVALTDGVAANITSISLTAGVWDISGIISFLADAVTGTAFVASLSATSATVGTVGDNRVDTPYPPTAGNNMSLTLPSYRVVTNATINYYLVGFASFTVGTVNACGRISATRVG